MFVALVQLQNVGEDGVSDWLTADLSNRKMILTAAEGPA